jgi:uncharacterized membrane protein
MILLIIGLVLFLAIHLVPAAPAIRAGVVARIGEPAYKLGFAALALLAVVLLAIGMGEAEYVPVWNPPALGRDVAPALMAVSVLLVLSAYMPNNLRRLVRHPMLWGVVAWSVAHLLVAGHLAAILLFGGLGAYAVFAIVSQTLRGAVINREPRDWWWDLVILLVAAAVYGGLILAHPWLFGASVL